MEFSYENMKSDQENMMCVPEPNTSATLVLPAQPTRLRGGGNGEQSPKPRNLSVNINCGGQKKTRMPKDYNEFLNDVIRCVQDLGDENSGRKKDKVERPSYNVSVNLVSPDQGFQTPTFDPLPLLQAFYPPACQAALQSAGDQQGAYQAPQAMQCNNAGRMMGGNQPEIQSMMMNSAGPCIDPALRDMLPHISGVVRQVWAPYGGAGFPGDAQGGQVAAGDELSGYSDVYSDYVQGQQRC